MFISVDHLPPSLARFVNEKNQVDLEALQKEPNKLLKFFLTVKEKPLSQDLIQQAIAVATLKAIQNKLLTPGTLSHYHFLKLFCKCPELYSGHENEVAQHLNAFFDDLRTDPDNATLLKRTTKVIALVQTRFADLLTDEMLYQSFYTFDMKPCELIRFPRHPLLEAIPVWRPMLIGRFASQMCHLPGIKREMLLDLFKFIETGKLPYLSLKERLEYFGKAHELQFEKLKTTCRDEVKSLITEKTVLQVLHCALQYEDTNLIDACTTFLNQSGSDFALHWNPATGLKIQLNKMSENSCLILTEFSSHIESVVLPTANVVQQVIDAQCSFPEAMAIELFEDMDPAMLDRLMILLPKVKKCSLPVELYRKLKHFNHKHLSNIKLLNFNNGNNQQRSTVIPPKLKMLLDMGPKLITVQKHDERLFFTIPNDARERRNLDLSRCPQEIKDLITDEMLLNLLEFYSSALSVNLSGCTKFTDKAALALSRLNLTSIVLDDCTQVTDHTIQSLVNSPKKLSNVSLGGCQQITDQGILLLKNHLNDQVVYVVSLNFSGCRKLTGESIAAITKGCNLKHLDLSHCPLVTNAAVRKILVACKNNDNGGLASLKLSHCPHLTNFDPSPADPVEITSLANLYEIDLSYCPHLEERFLRRCASLPCLATINFSGCHNISISVIQKMIQTNPHNLHLNDCSQLTDDHVKTIAEISDIYTLSLQNCTQLTDAIGPYLQNINELQILDLRGCPSLTSTTRDRFTELTEFEFGMHPPPGSKRTSSQAGL